MIRCFFICQEEPFFIPKQVERILEKNGIHYRAIGATVLPPQRKGKGKLHWIRERARIHHPWELFLVAFAFMACKLTGPILRFLGRKDPFSVEERFKAYDVPLVQTQDIHSPSFVEKIRELAPDLIVSISCPQLFSRELLQIPEKYCLNLHGTLLPRHRGVFGSWWTLYTGDREAGASIHTMEERLDAGTLLWQESFPVEERDTQYALAERTKELMAEGLVDLLQEIDQGREEVLSPRTEASYNRAPKPGDAREFRRKGKKILRLSDLGRILRPTFGIEASAKKLRQSRTNA